MTGAPTRGRALAQLGAFAATIGFRLPAHAATKVRLLTNWFAQAEHGGYYQAKASARTQS